MHCWGDGFEYFNDVGNAAAEIGDFCRKWGKISVTQTKEKYGTARVYCHFGGYYMIHDLFWPGHVASRYPFGFSKFDRLFKKTVGKKIYEMVGNMMWRTDHFLSRILLRNKFVSKWLCRYQVWIYKKAYERALRKYPHITREILYGADWEELLKHLMVFAMVRELFDKQEKEECPF